MSLSNFSYYLRDYRLWMVIGLVGAAALAHYGEAEARQIGHLAAIVLAGLLVLALLVWVVKRMLARRAAKRVEAMVKDEGGQGGSQPSRHSAPIPRRCARAAMDAVSTIKSSRMGC
jgi:type VI secretion system protein ImpL